MSAQAQFASVPPSALKSEPPPSAASVDKDYRLDAARHVYAAFPGRVHKG
jgi:hypothetical protein